MSQGGEAAGEGEGEEYYDEEEGEEGEAGAAGEEEY